MDDTWTLEQARHAIADKKKQEAYDLEIIIPMLQQYIRCLRGESEDLTGLGLKRIIIGLIEQAWRVKVTEVVEEC